MFGSVVHWSMTVEDRLLYENQRFVVLSGSFLPPVCHCKGVVKGPVTGSRKSRTESKDSLYLLKRGSHREREREREDSLYSREVVVERERERGGRITSDGCKDL